MEIIIECDVCGNKFLPEDYEIYSLIYEEIIVKCLECPLCKKKYPFLYIDNKQENLTNNIQSLQYSIEVRKHMGKSVPAARTRKLSQLLEESKKHQALLRDKYKQAVTDQLNKIKDGEIETYS